jgi:hypothetical protein
MFPWLPTLRPHLLTAVKQIRIDLAKFLPLYILYVFQGNERILLT